MARRLCQTGQGDVGFDLMRVSKLKRACSLLDAQPELQGRRMHYHVAGSSGWNFVCLAEADFGNSPAVWLELCEPWMGEEGSLFLPSCVTSLLKWDWLLFCVRLKSHFFFCSQGFFLLVLTIAKPWWSPTASLLTRHRWGIDNRITEHSGSGRRGFALWLTVLQVSFLTDPEMSSFMNDPLVSGPTFFFSSETGPASWSHFLGDKSLKYKLF